MCLFRVVVSTDWSAPGQGSLVIAAGSDVSHGIALSGLAAFLSLELKHN